MNKKITQLSFVLTLTLIFQTCNASIIDDILEWFNPALASEQKVIEIVDEPKGVVFELVDMSGNIYTQNETKGKYLIVNFWATWCGPCKAEIPGFIDLQNKYKDDLVILGISVDRRQTRDRVAPFAKDYNINYPVLFTDGKIEKDYGGINGIPTTFILDRELNIAQEIVGYRSDAVFEQAIKSLL